MNIGVLCGVRSLYGLPDMFTVAHVSVVRLANGYGGLTAKATCAHHSGLQNLQSIAHAACAGKYKDAKPQQPSGPE